MKEFINEGFIKRPEEFVRQSLLCAGVDHFWTAAAMQWISRCLVSNRHFVSHLESAKIDVDRLKFAAKVELSGVSVYPDSKKEAACIITYTFDKKNHKVNIAAKNFKRAKKVKDKVS